jgi:hypothetical protein
MSGPTRISSPTPDPFLLFLDVPLCFVLSLLRPLFSDAIALFSDALSLARHALLRDRRFLKIWSRTYAHLDA